MTSLLANFAVGVAITGGLVAFGWLLWQLVKIVPWYVWLLLGSGGE